MVFVRTKRINNRDYYYLVKSVRNGKNIERYIGLNPPSENDLRLFLTEHNSTKIFLARKEAILKKIRDNYRRKIKESSHDELAKLDEFVATQFTYNTSRIEGSTLTFRDTNLLLNQGISPSNKPINDIREADNHKKAFFFLKNCKKDVDKSLILSLHRILKQDISEDAGSFRNAQVRVGDMIGLNPKLISAEIDNLLAWYRRNYSLVHPLELVSEFHCTFERIHPFFDGNGRVGRLLMNHTLMRKGFPPAIIQNRNKKRYYNALIRGQKGNYLLMIKYLVSELERFFELLS